MIDLALQSPRRLLGGAAAFAGTVALADAGLLRAGRADQDRHADAADRRRRPLRPAMLKAVKAVVDEVNAAGGVLGRKVELVSEDDQTNPEAGVRAARKLIDVDKVPAIMGTWASAVTTAVAPLCWESKTFLATVSGADSITQLPHQGYLIRTQPNTKLQGRKFGEFAISLRVPSASSSSRRRRPSPRASSTTCTEVLKKGGGDGRAADLRRQEADLPLRDRPGAALQARRCLPRRLHAGHDGAAEGPVPRRLSRAQGRATATR